MSTVPDAGGSSGDASLETQQINSPIWRHFPPELQIRTVELMTLEGLLAWRTTSQHGDLRVRLELRRTMHDLLYMFVSDPLGLRALMRAQGCVISGSAALWFLDRGASWTPSDLDLYVPHANWNTVIDYLETREGGVTQRVGAMDDSIEYTIEAGVSAIAHVLTPRGKIDVIRSTTSSATYPIPHFWTGLLMNTLDADRVVSSHWDLVSQRRALYSPRTFTEREWVAVDKYIERGYDFSMYTRNWRELEWQSCHKWYCPHRLRTFSDNGNFQMTFHEGDSSGLPPRGPQTLPGADVVAWRLGGGPCCGTCIASRSPHDRSMFVRCEGEEDLREWLRQWNEVTTPT